MKIERLPMQHAYDAGTWVAEVDALTITVSRDGIRDVIAVEIGEGPFNQRWGYSINEARALVQMLTEALEAVKEEE